MPEKQGDKDNMSGWEAATKKSCNYNSCNFGKGKLFVSFNLYYLNSIE